MRIPLLLIAAAAMAAAPETRVGPDAVWAPLMDVDAQLHVACKNASGKGLGKCLRDYMKQTEASPEAIAFSETLDQPGYLREFIPKEKIDLGRIDFPFRANTNQTIYFLNGDPPRIDEADDKVLKKVDLSREPLYRENRRAWKSAFLVFDGFTLPERVPTNDGFRFTASVPLRTCHACEDLAVASIAYDFTNAGKFRGAKLLSLEKPSR